MASILIVGCGEIGFRIGLGLRQQGHDVVGLKRQPPSSPPFTMLSADITRPETLAVLNADFDLALFIVSPDRREPAAYQALYDQGLAHLLTHFAVKGGQPRWLMVSSTSVYGQNDGEWVDETSPAEADSPTAQWLAAAERRLWQNDPRHCVIRFAGIYGPGRTWLLRRVAAGEPIQQQPPSFTNRIHVDDAVNVVLFLAQRLLAGDELDNCYLASDDEPVALFEVMAWLAEQLGYPAPTPLFLSPETPRNKRCCNHRLKQLGFTLAYPSYRDGYASMLAVER